MDEVPHPFGLECENVILELGRRVGVSQESKDNNDTPIYAKLLCGRYENYAEIDMDNIPEMVE